MANRNEWVADRRLYLDKDGKVVEANDPSRATLLVAAGNTIPIEDAERLGLTKASQGPSENKLRVGPAQNKVAEVVPGVSALDIEEEVRTSREEVPAIEAETERDDTPKAIQEDGQGLPPAAEPEIVFDPAPALEAAIEEAPKRRGRKASEE